MMTKDWVGLIGSRKASQKENMAAYSVAKTYVSKGKVVVSGLAKGIDEYAHKGALDGGGKTIAIVNTPSFQSIYPEQNQSLAERIKQQGEILYPFETRAVENRNEKPSHFSKRMIERDVLLAYLCPIIIVVKDSAEEIDGGTRWAVNYGLAYGKRVYRMDSNGKFYDQIAVKKSKIWWEMELDLTKYNHFIV